MESFTLLPRAEFENLVAQALDDLPPYFQLKMSNVEIVIEAWSTRDDLQVGRPYGQTLLGLYHGVPSTQRGDHYQLVLPDGSICLSDGAGFRTKRPCAGSSSSGRFDSSAHFPAQVMS